MITDMIQTIDIAGLRCMCCACPGAKRTAYVLYPMDMLSRWIEQAARKYEVNIVVITGMDWESVFSPWPAKGVPRGSADFQGRSPEFLKLLQQEVIPRVEALQGIDATAGRALVGVSMSGLFALWQWMLCDTFGSIASLSGSFWYEGFVEWMRSRSIPAKTGKAFFLLGERESHSGVRAFNSVGENTREIVEMLRAAGIDTEFQSVPGDHFADPVPRLEAAFTALF